jgi:hypothetical protein
MVGKNEFGSFNLETLKFLMHFREPESLLYFIFTHTHIFSLFLFFLYTHFFSFSFSLFYLLPLNSKIALYLPPPHA